MTIVNKATNKSTPNNIDPHMSLKKLAFILLFTESREGGGGEEALQSSASVHKNQGGRKATTSTWNITGVLLRRDIKF